MRMQKQLPVSVAFQKPKTPSATARETVRQLLDKNVKPLAANVLTALGSAVFAGTTALSLAAPPAQARSVTYNLDIPSQSLGDALQALALASEHKLLYSAEVVDGKTSVAIKGVFTADEAVRQLLSGTDLSYEVRADGLVIVEEKKAKSTGMTARETGIRLSRLDTEPAEQEPRADPALEEVVVTAQKREERLKDVPISISVLGGTELESPNVTSARDALGTIPGIAINQAYTGSGTTVTVRGVSASQTLFSGSAPVGYYLDSMPFGLVKSAIAPDLNVYDLERIEALRGPQGTLYGASALNGVVRVLTRDADLEALTAKVRAAGSSTQSGGEGYRGDLAVNVPIIEGKLAARAVVGYEDVSGWVDTPATGVTNDAQLRNYRLKVNAQPTQDLSLRLSYWGTRDDLGAPNTAGEDGVSPAVLNQATQTGFDSYDLTANYQFSGYSLSSSTSYLDYDYDARIDFTNLLETVYSQFGAPFGLHTRIGSRILAEEVLLRSPADGLWRWSIGSIYRRGTEDRYQTNLVTGIFSADADSTSESWAAFGELTRLLMDGRLEATVGLRYFKDQVTQDGYTPDVPLLSNEGKYHATTPRAVLTWHASENLTLYGSYAQGFRSGFPPEITAPPGIPSAGPDKLSNYEMGAKGAFAEGRVTFDIAAYYIDWQDVQMSISVPTNVGGVEVFTGATINGESASGPGVDLALNAKPTNGLTLGISASWNQLEMDGEVFSDGTQLWGKGDRLNTSPETTLGASAVYEFPLGASGFGASLSASAAHTSRQEYRATPGLPVLIRGRGDPMTVGRVGLSIDSPKTWTATLFVNNVTNEDGAVIRPFETPSLMSRIQPRTVGLQLEYRLQ